MDSRPATTTSAATHSHCEPLRRTTHRRHVDAAAELADIVARGHPSFAGDTILQRAAERLLEIIGEAASTLSDQVVEATPGVPWRDIRRLRIVLAHHYHRIDPEQVWVIASRHVPAMVDDLTQLRST